MTWWEFFEILENATYEEMKSVYFQKIQTTDQSDLNELREIQYYYQQAEQYFKKKRNSQMQIEKPKENTLKVQFKKIPLSSFDHVDFEHGNEVKVNKNKNKNKKAIFIIRCILFIPVIIYVMLSELFHLFIKYYKTVISITIIISCGVILSQSFQRPDSKEVRQTPKIVYLPKPLSEQELRTMRLQEAQTFYQQRSDQLKDKEYIVPLITACTLKFPENYTYQKALTGEIEHDTQQEEYNRCFDV